MSLTGKIAVVTGGASGIGLATAQRLVREGAAVAIWDLDESRAVRAADELVSGGGRALACRVDVSRRDQVSAATETVHAKLGPVSILVNNAGITDFRPFMEYTEEIWDRVMTVNLKSLLLVTQALLPDMLNAGWGRIINISSSSAQTGSPRMTAYSASKGGVIVFTKSLALELASTGVTVNNVPPGFIDTPMLRAVEAAGSLNVNAVSSASPMKRPGKPEDIAAACAFLASEDAAYITGQTLGVNGGRYTS